MNPDDDRPIIFGDEPPPPRPRAPRRRRKVRVADLTKFDQAKLPLLTYYGSGPEQDDRDLPEYGAPAREVTVDFSDHHLKIDLPSKGGRPGPVVMFEPRPNGWDVSVIAVDGEDLSLALGILDDGRVFMRRGFGTHDKDIDVLSWGDEIPHLDDPDVNLQPPPE